MEFESGFETYTNNHMKTRITQCDGDLDAKFSHHRKHRSNHQDRDCYKPW